MTEAKWLETKTCGCCGKKFSVLYPELWRYKRRADKGSWWKYFCSWGCLRATEKTKGSRNMTEEKKGHSQIEIGKELAEAMEKGADPEEFLKEKGYTNPMKAYQNIKAKCRNEAPEIFARFPKRLPNKRDREAKEEPAEAGAAEKAVKEIRELPPVTVEEDLVTEERPDLWRTTAIRNDELGEFYHDTVHRSVDWRHPYGEEISLPPDVWQRLWEELPGILRSIGVK